MRILAASGVPIVGASGAFLGEIGASLILEAAFALEVEGGRVIATIGTVPVAGQVDYRVTVEGLITGDPTTRTIIIRSVTSGTRDLGDADDLLGPFASTPWEGLILGIRTYDDLGNPGVFNPVLDLLDDPAAPGQLAATAATGAPGEIDVTITDEAVDPGDGTTPGDGLGGTLTVQYRIGRNDGTIATLGDGVLEEATKAITNLPFGSSVPVEVRVTSAFRPGPWSDLGTITAGTAVLVPPVFTPGPALNLVAGNTLVIQWTSYFSGAVSYNVVSGISGGVQSGTGNVTYTKAGLAQGSYTIQCVATAADGSTTTGSVSVVVAASVVAPSLVSPLNEVFLVPVGSTINYDVSPHFAGSSLTFTRSPASSAFGFSPTQPTRLVNLTALSAAIPQDTFTITATNSAGSASDTITFGVTAAAPAQLVTTGATPDATVHDAQLRYAANPPTTVNNWRFPRCLFPGLAANCLPFWTTTVPNAEGQVPAGHREIFDLVGGYYVPIMTDPAKRGNPESQNPRLDYSVFSDTETVRAGRFYVGQYNTITGLYSLPSAVALSVPPVTSAPERTWLPALTRFKETFDAKVVGNTGQQFERVACWNWGRNDPDKAGHILFGQDENNCWMSQNGTETTGPALMGSPIADGMFCTNISGIYLNSDDNIVLVAGGGYPFPNKTGLYLSTDWTKTFIRVLTERPGFPDSGGGTRGFVNIINGSTMRRPQNCIARRPQNPAGSLTHAQRPIYVIENHMPDGAPATSIFVWRSDDNMATITCIASLAPATYIGTGGESGGIRYIDVAPNGDVMISTPKGVWRSQDLGVTWTRCSILGNTTDRDIVAIGWRGGDASTVSGAYCAINSATAGGVVRTDNIRTTGFTRPAGQTAAIATRASTHMGVSPANTDRLILVSGGAPMISTDGGVIWSEVTENPGTGANAGNYNITGGPSAVYPHPYEENVWFATTTQTVSRSINGGVSFEGDLVAFFSGEHDRGWGFAADAGDGDDGWKKMIFVQQDYSVRHTDAGFDYFYNSAVNYSDTYGNTTMGAVMLAADAGNTWGYTSGQGAIMTPVPDRVIFGQNRNSDSRTNVMCIGEDMRPESDTPGTTTDTGHLRAVIMRNDLPISRNFCQRHHPTLPGITYLGRYRISNMDRPSKVLGADPIRINVGSTYARVSETAHGRTAGTPVSIARASATGTFGWLQADGTYQSRSYFVHGRFPVIRHERLAFTAGDVEPAIGATITKGGVSAVVQGVVLSSGSWAANNAAGYLEIISRTGGSFTAGSMTSGATLTVSGAQTADADAYMVDTADNGLTGTNSAPIPRERVQFSGGQVAPGATITQGGVSATVVYVAVTSGAWTAAATGRAAGYIGISNRTGGSFAAGAITAGGTLNLAGAQSAATVQGGGSVVRIVGEVDFVDMGREVRDFFLLDNQTISYWTANGLTSTTIHRSTDTLGGNQQPWITLAGGRTVTRAGFAADPFQPERVIYGSGSDVREIRSINGVLVDSVLVDLRDGIVAYMEETVTAYGDRLMFTAGSVSPTVGGTIVKGAVSATCRKIVVTSGTWGGGNAAGYLVITNRTGGNFTAGALTSGGTLTVSGQQLTGYGMPGSTATTILNDYHNPGFFLAIVAQHGTPGVWMTETNGYERLAFTAGGGTAPVAGTTLTQGAVTARTQNVVVSSGTFGGGNAAGYVEISNRTGGDFAAGAVSGATITASGKQTGGWANVTDYLPRVPLYGVVHPYTGDIIVMWSKGRFIRPPAPGYPAGQNRGASYNQVRAFYDQAGVPKPPIY